jgi:hypothetical protein
MFQIFQNIFRPQEFGKGYSKGKNFRIGDTAIDFGPLNPFIAGTAEALSLPTVYPDDKDNKISTTSTPDETKPPDDSNLDIPQDDNLTEQQRMDAIRRMLAGRYGRAETNLTMGRSFGAGSGRSLTGMS